MNCLKGINWGLIELDEKKITISNDGKNLMNIDLKKLQNSIISKNDIIIELATDDCDDETLCEIRLFMPPNVKNESDDQELNYAETMHQSILNKIDVCKPSESVITLNDLQLIAPRGKYKLHMYKTNARFIGSTYNYLVDYKNINRAFLLPLNDEINFSFILSLDVPIKQGNTVHQYIIMNLRNDEVEPISVRLHPQEYTELDMDENYEGQFVQIVATVFKKLVKVNIYVPGKFKSQGGQASVKCNVKTSPGLLYPLQTSIMFINKPVIYVSNKDIKCIEFHRITKGSKMFDVKILTVNQSLVFTGIEKAEYDELLKYFEDKKITIKKVQENMQDDQEQESESNSNNSPRKNDGDVDEEEDSDFEGGEGSADEDEIDEEIEESEISQIEDKKPKKNKK